MCSDLAVARERNDLEFFAAVPVSKLQLALGFASVATVFIAPPVLLTMLIGSWWFGYQIQWTLWILPVMLLSALSMAGLGIFLGVRSRSVHHAVMLQNLMLLGVMFLSLALIPLENLPSVLRWTSRLLPTSYAADACRAVFAGQLDARLWLNLAVLAAISVASLWLTTTRLDWRMD